jgi:molybdopterin-synthase adenylyltransferase
MRVISIAQPTFASLRASLFTPDGNENAAFALCGYSRNEGADRLYVRQTLPVPPGGYDSRTPVHLEVSPRFINEIVDLSRGRMAIVVIHSHPGGLTSGYSASDDFGEERLLRVLSDLVPEAPHASLLFSEEGVIGRFWSDGHFSPVSQIRIVGSSLPGQIAATRPKSRARPTMEIDTRESRYSRQIMAFGPDAQSELERIRVAIIGLGGTGSCVAEQLARLGVRDFLLVDHDRFAESNLTRMYGSTAADEALKPLKAEIVGRNLATINPSIRVASAPSTIVSRRTLSRLVGRDVLFCCTDNETSRAVLNRFAYQYLTPLIDMGTRIVVRGNQVVGAAGRATIVGPGLPCLWCAFHLDALRIRAETLPVDELKKLTAEGYVEGMDVTGPSVVSLNSTVASLSVTMLLGMIAPFGQVPQNSSEQIYDVMEGIVFKVSATRDPNCHVCGERGVTGYGDLEPVTTYP